jgi:hypothetical protein
LGVCTAITRGGGRCKGVAIDASGLCHAHHPGRAENRSRAARKGGKRGGRGRPVAELAALRGENAELRRRLLESGEGGLAPNVAAVAIQSINTDIRAVVAALKAREQEELEGRLEALEEYFEGQRAGQGQGSGGW